MKLSRFLCVIVMVLACAAGRLEAGGPGWHGGGGGWHGGGGWGGGGVVIVTPGYYYPAYPYYPGYYGYQSPAAYNDGAGTVSVATAVQEQLSQLGYYKGPIDGIIGAGTRAAISAYQRNHGLEVNGGIDTPLLRSLRL